MADANHPSRRALPAPAPGTFIHPAGRRYALEVLRVSPAASGDHPRLPVAVCRRWGWDGGRVVDDGYRGQSTQKLRYRAAGCWTTPSWEGRPPGDSSSELWRTVPGPAGQMGLFGGGPC